MEDWHNFGADYDTTLMAWYERFLASWPEIADNYSERFKRMFSYYLNACAGAFRGARYSALAGGFFSRGRTRPARGPLKIPPHRRGYFLLGRRFQCRLFRRQHALDGIDDRLSLRIDFNIHPIAQLFHPKRGALQRFRN
ncbi:cyclopropane-fatty-acyl-phospholipid synthase [Klebsiella michiganensis]|uniref:Cyclopropane-fatty-acyl-phospholipid synthase n=1 Tax=Klebsiella michiganensis TaxID=1134687 RepID=A0A7H4PLP4_9ENTR|nr:cyclopropane-fatty-acyl-phospholipid synthase [Klebsiella michiganensis]